MPLFTNIAAYKFARLEDLKSLRDSLLADCKAWELKGTILLSPEGVNLFIAGPEEAVENLLQRLRAISGLEDLQPKYSLSEHQPFTRMLVRLKKEIIAFGVEGIDPAQRTSPKLQAQTLKQWLDEGRPVTLLDTRNDYEVKLGTFKGAHTLDIDHFRNFPAAVRELPSEMKKQPIVMFCTGGIRCEKAGPFMEREGFEEIYQLDGGILKYFEECGSDHYDGECFVFDQRVGVDPALQESGGVLCFACQSPLTAEESNDPRYVPAKSCPYCYQTTEQQMAVKLAASQSLLTAASTPLPGSDPYDNYRPLNVPAAYDGQTLLDCLCGVFPHVGREEWLRITLNGQFVSQEREPLAPTHIVRGGERCLRKMPNVQEPEVNADIRLLHEDEAILVLEKPAPLPMHPAGRYNRNTLQFILDVAYHPRRVRPAHRLDANTTGVVVCTFSRHFAKILQPQFSRGEVTKTYLTRVQGHPVWDEYTCDLPISEHPSKLGTREIDEDEGQSAETRFRVLSRDEDGTALLEVRPITGRTNQIRVHLWHCGLPIVGDQAYLPDNETGATQTLPLGAPPLCLHAWKLRFSHPVSREQVEFTSQPPEWTRLTAPAEMATA